jgi:hypothetical protein
MHNNNIYDAGAAALGRALATNDALEYLGLSSNVVGNEGAKGLAEGLKENKALRRLDMYFNVIKDEGAVALADALSINRGLRMLHVDTNMIGDVGGLALAHAISGVETIKSHWGATHEKAREHPSMLGELTIMYNQLTNKGADAMLAAAATNRYLHKLAIDQNHMVHGETREAVENSHNPLMQSRHAIAKWIVDHELVEKGWHNNDGPPLSSAYAPVVGALMAHTKDGILELRHENAASLAQRPELESLSASEKEALIKQLLDAVAKATAHDEL